MIAAKDLRVSNWISIPECGSIAQVEIIGPKKFCIDPTTIDLDKEDTSFDYSSAKGIVLSPEILEKAGFEKSNEFDDTFRFKEFDLYYRKSYCEWTVDDRGDNEGSKPRFIKYLHQLQNVYDAITGEELIVNL